MGLLATHLGLAMWPALFSLAMVLGCSLVMGIVYSMLDTRSD
jgi:hypothetical protein